MPKHYAKREGSRYGQTWHGTPLKRIGFDIENLQMANKNYLKQFAKEVAKWDALVSPNPYSTEIFRRAFRYDGPVLETGYPRNDVFHRPEDRAARTAEVRSRLGIEPGKQVILYAPTWRDNQYDTRGPLPVRDEARPRADVPPVQGRRGAPHPRSPARREQRRHLDVRWLRPQRLVLPGHQRPLPRRRRPRHRLLLGDVRLRQHRPPMLFFTHDLEAYRDDLRGFYLDFEAEAPGPLLTHTTEVIDALGDLDRVAAEHAGRYEAFREKFASLEDGRAAARFVDQFLTDGA